MSESIKLNGDKYIDASGVYDSAKGKTQSQINGDLNSHIIIRQFTSTLSYEYGVNGAIDINISISQVDGYTPILAVYAGNDKTNLIFASQSSRSIGSTETSVGFWTANASSSEAFSGVKHSCYVLYQKNV